jgi:PAS domain S-box-containing protein
MSVPEPTRAELLAELAILKQRIADLESAEQGRRRVEAQLRASEERFRALIDATGEDVVVLLDAEGRMMIVNERTARSVGLRVEDMVGRRLDEVLPPEVGRRRMEMACEVLGQGRPVRFEDERAGFWFDNIMCPVWGPDGMPQGVAIFARDVTERKLAEAALSSAKESAERANLAKSRFLAAANHDLRQPLQAMAMLIEALAYKGTDAHAAEIVGDMRATLAVMETLLNALLDISKLDAGIVTPRSRRVSAVPFLERIRDQFRPLAAERRVRVRLFPRNAVMSTDPALLERVLYNLLSNAIRHARDGVLIACRRREGQLRIEVWDNGEGIPGDQLGHIFEEFYQLGNPARSRDQGLGLGLAIAKRLATLLGLALGARSRIGRGSMFFVEVPVAGPEGAATEVREPVAPSLPDPPAGASGALILVVEDDDRVMTATVRMLRLWGFRTLCADSKASAVDLLLDSGLTPDVALVDYRLPDGSDGVELLQEIRGRLGVELPAVLVTGDTAVQRLRSVQASGYPVLHKPVAPADLRRAILAQCGGRPGRLGAGSPPEPDE